MRSFVPVLCVLAFFVGVASFAGGGSGVQAVDLPVRSVDLPTRPVSFPEPVVDPLPFVAEDEVCNDGSCAASGPVASVAQVATASVRRVVQAKPVRRVVGRVFSRLRGCR